MSSCLQCVVQLCENLAEAKDMTKALELQNSHARKQMETFSSQLEEIRDLAANIIKEASEHKADTSDDEGDPGEDDEGEKDDEDDEDKSESKGSSSFRRW